MASRKAIYFGLAVLWFGASLVQATRTNSLVLRAEEKAQQQKIRGVSTIPELQMGRSVSRTSKNLLGYPAPEYRLGSGGLVLSSKGSSWIGGEQPSPKVIQVHDLVSIIVHETSKHTSREYTKANREYTIDAALEDWLRLSNYNLRPDKQSRGDPTITLDFEREFRGKGDVKRQDTLTARIQAEVIDVLPNGNLILEATHTIVTNEEETHITLTGTCRSKDVGIDNKILSDNLAQLEIRKMQKGIVRDTNKRGLLSGLIDMLAIF